ncbi:spore germination protein [Bacillus sp. FJAT-49736]|uniref:spore germination protein n=1 Tax=Bacillus sp. FJAT-49736 TaxID=2833582 RepID=UPI001BC9BD7D|nr:spore germination protein [Bacillus sp. FJAT-49736]MBS4172636.1 spore germination protein [Bacillus sp. FJAT-49736]
MPAFIGNSQILNVGGTAAVNFGDTAFISPKTAAKTTHGSSGGGTAVINIEFTAFSINNTFDTSIFEQPMTGNN